MASIGRREFIGAAAAAAAGLGLEARAEGAGAAGQSRPNVIFILTDDLGYGDIGCYNVESRIPTPHVDALAAAGTRFTDAHSPSAVCTPTRYGLLTGRYCWRTWLKRGVVGGYTPPLIEPDRDTVATVLKRVGYATGFFGKWHLGVSWARMNGFRPTWRDGERLFRGSWQDAAPSTGMTADFTKPVEGGPADHGFDEAYFTAACPTIDGPFVYIDKNRTVGLPTLQVSNFYDMTKGEEGSPRKGWLAPGYKLEEVDLQFTRKAIAFMEERRRADPNQPIFVSLFLSAPHTPWLPPEFVKGKSQDGPRGDLVVLADWCVGEIVRAVERLGMAQDTLIVFTSDNGPHPGTNGHFSAGRLRGLKSQIWEGGHRVPFVARWPARIRPGSMSAEPICLVDTIATLAGFAGARLSPDAGPDSYDISPALFGSTRGRPIREALVSHSENGTFAIRRGPWKLVLDNKTSGGWMVPEGKPPVPRSPGQLFNLAEDPFEQRDLWGTHADIVQELRTLLERYQREGRSAPRRAL